MSEPSAQIDHPVRPIAASSARSRRAPLLIGVALLAAGCTEVKGRHLIQQGNALYKDGKYPEAVRKFEEAAELIPNFPTLWLNMGFACKRMIVPGSKSPESVKAADCAIDAFDRFRKLVPEDTRGEMLYTQTLFDADRFETIVKIYEKRFQDNPKDSQAVNILMQVYTKWDAALLPEGKSKLDEALQWYKTNVEQRPDDPEAYYAVGTFIYTQLNNKGGGPDKMCWDPRKGAVNKPDCQPLERTGDIIGAQRIDLADEGIRYLEKAIELRPTYTDAMTYINLLWRQRAYGLFPVPEEWWASMQKAEEWKEKTLAILRERGVASVAVMPRAALGGIAQSQEEIEAALAGDDEDDDGGKAAGKKRAAGGAKKKAGKSTKGKGKR